MLFMDFIIQKLNAMSTFFWEIYLVTSGWYPPFDFVAPYFYDVSVGFNYLAWRFYDFALWVNSVVSDLQGILDFGDIWSYFDYWFNRAEWAWDWVASSWTNVGVIVDSWWSSTQFTVLAWVDEAKSYADSLVAGFNTWLGNLQSAWDDF